MKGINVITPLVLTSMVKDVTMTVPIVMPNPYLHSANCEMADHPAMADIGKVIRTIGKIPSGSIVRLGGMTDCFQPLEYMYHTAYKAIEELNRRKIGYLIVTKSSMVADD